MAWLISYQAFCDCAGCSGCAGKRPTPGIAECMETSDEVFASTLGEARRSSIMDGWSQHAGRLRCPACAGKRRRRAAEVTQ